MKRIVAFGFLLLFLFSTSATYASVHRCDGELTDVAILSTASCDHDAVHQHFKEKPCCLEHELTGHDQNDHKCCDTNACDDSEEDDCCQTEELNVFKSDVSQEFSTTASVVYKQLASFAGFYCKSFQPDLVLCFPLYMPPLINRNIMVEVQCFRI